MSETIFTKIVAGEIPCAKVYEDETVLAFLDIAPNVKGHTLVIPKKAAKDITEVSEADWTAMQKAVRIISAAVIKATGAAGVNIITNNGTAAGQEVLHIHTHILPRFEGDGAISWKQKEQYADGEMEQFREKIASSVDA